MVALEDGKITPETEVDTGNGSMNTCHIYRSITSPVPVVVSHLAAVHIHNTVAREMCIRDRHRHLRIMHPLFLQLGCIAADTQYHADVGTVDESGRCV